MQMQNNKEHLNICQSQQEVLKKGIQELRNEKQKCDGQLIINQNKKGMRQTLNNYQDFMKGDEGKLVDDCIEIIRHQQYLLDNLNHLDDGRSYNEILLSVWKFQINLMDSFTRFQYYKSLWKLKELLRRLKKIMGDGLLKIRLDEGFNLEFIQKVILFGQLFVLDCKVQENELEQIKGEILFLKCRLENNQDIHSNLTTTIFQKIYQFLGDEQNKTEYLILVKIFEFYVKVIGFGINSKICCELCKINSFQNMGQVLDHIQNFHLNFLKRLYLGMKDQCFDRNCKSHHSNGDRMMQYDFQEHLMSSHSIIFNQDKIFSKLYKGSSKKAFCFFYASDQKNMKKKFKAHFFEWLEQVNYGLVQFVQDKKMLEQRGNLCLVNLKNWIEQEEELLANFVGGNYKDFDVLCFLLKLSWFEGLKGLQTEEGYQELDWIREKFKYGNIRRIQLIENVAELLDTQKSFIHQLHRYLYLGVFNFSLNQGGLNKRVAKLEKLVKQIGIFQSVLYNWNEYHNVCQFEDILCRSAKFLAPVKMFEHYFDGHLGICYALSDHKLKRNLDQEYQIGRITRNYLKDLPMSELIFFLHDYYQADYKSKSKRYMSECKKNFQLKGVCCDCQKELYHFGQVYWKENKENLDKGLTLRFKHSYTVLEVISAYKHKMDNTSFQQNDLIGQIELSAHSKREIDLLVEQCELFKRKLFGQMKTEILIDEKGRQSQCKDCNKNFKGFNPILKELKAEYFQLPLEELEIENIFEKNDGLNKKLEIHKNDPEFIQIQKQILNREVEDRVSGSWFALKQQMEGGYFRLESFPKLVNIYGEISESVDQNSRRVISQPILNGYMKVLFSTPLIYVPNTSIIYEMQPQWAKVRQRFKLVSPGSEQQRREMIQMLDSHPIMQNHTYQITKLTQLCVDQVDLMFQLNKHLMKQTRDSQLKGQNQIGEELTKTSDLLYFEGVLHRAQVTFLVQQFRIWDEVFFENACLKIRELGNNNYVYDKVIINKAITEIDKFIKMQDRKWKNFILMLVLSQYYCESALKQMNFDGYCIQNELGDESKLLDYLLSDSKSNPIRFIIESHLIPILTPLISQFIHPIFLGTLLQLFQLDFTRNEIQTNNLVEQQNIGEKYSDCNSLKYYLDLTYDQLSKLTIKRCLPLSEFNGCQMKRKRKQQHGADLDQYSQEEESSFEEQIIEKRREKLKKEERWFQLKMFNKLNKAEKIDMQCRYVLAKRSLLKVLNSKREDPPVDCDLRWAMQIAQMFYHSIQKRAVHGKDDENRAARQFVKDLRVMKEEANHYFNNNKASIPEDFLFKSYRKNGQEIVSDLRKVLEEILKEDQRSNNNQVFNRNQYKYIHRLKIAYFIPMEKKLKDINECISKLRSLPHRSIFRSMEKFHKYNFRELELLAFPELFATGQGFQQHMAPKIERSSIVIGIEQ